MFVKLTATAATLAILTAAGGAAAADPVADFYAGKRITMLISSSAGSGYDLYARLLSNNLGRFIPGHPTIIPQNKPGAGGMSVANAAYNSSPRDGTTMFTLHFTLPLYQAMGGQGVRFDVSKFSGVGRLLASNVVIGVIANSKSQITDVKDAIARPAVLGSTGATSNATLYPTILNNMVHTKFKIVQGYQSQDDVFLAMERGELDGFGSYSYLTLKSVKPDYLTKKLFHPLVQWGERREEEWAQVPLAEDLAANDVDRRAMRIASAGSDIGFSYFMTPGVPAERLAAIRKAFDAMVADPKFLADAERARMVLRPATGQAMEKIVAEVLSAPQAAIDRLALLMSSDGEIQCSEFGNTSLCKSRAAPNAGDAGSKN